MGESMSRNRKKKAKRKGITVHIYESEYRQIQAWVDKHQNLETGGDLFGLWADENTAVVQLVLGPGKHCTRTPTSFFQDIKYLERVGNLLTYKEGLCHIGEWHSHHRLGLKEPSGGDKNTVWSNMERYGIYRFCLFIATIDGSWSRRGSIQDDVSVNGFLFEINRETHHPEFQEVKFEQIQEESPFSLKYEEDIKIGAESVNNEDQSQSCYVPMSEKKKNKKGDYVAMELGNVVQDEEPEDTEHNPETSGICSFFPRLCPTCFIVYRL